MNRILYCYYSKDRGQFIVVANRDAYPKNWLKGHGNETDLREFKAKIGKA
jgi:hypothetical protein